jgi:hypothetical protein
VDLRDVAAAGGVVSERADRFSRKNSIDRVERPSIDACANGPPDARQIARGVRLRCNAPF